MAQSKYPECEKLLKFSKKSQMIGEFLEWLRNTKEITLARWDKDECDFCRTEDDVLVPAYDATEKLLAEFFGIDMDKVEKERQQLLEELRENKE